MPHPLLPRFRAETADLHRRLDGHPALEGLTQPRGLEAYAFALGALHAPLAALEAAVAGGPHPYAPRRPALEADLRTLGRAPLGHPPGPPPAGDPAALSGYLYVLEGARLGASVLVRRLPPDWPARFFAEADGARRWSAFGAFLAGADPAPEPALAAARLAFRLFLDHLDGIMASPAWRDVGAGAAP